MLKPFGFVPGLKDFCNKDAQLEPNLLNLERKSQTIHAVLLIVKQIHSTEHK